MPANCSYIVVKLLLNCWQIFVKLLSKLLANCLQFVCKLFANSLQILRELFANCWDQLIFSLEWLMGYQGLRNSWGISNWAKCLSVCLFVSLSVRDFVESWGAYAPKNFILYVAFIISNMTCIPNLSKVSKRFIELSRNFVLS